MQIRIGVKIKNVFNLLLIVGVLGLGLIGGYYYRGKKNPQVLSGNVEKNKYISFSTEIYDKIKDNYWDTISDQDLVDSYVLAIEKVVGQPQHIKKQDRAGLEEKIEEILKLLDTDEKKKEFVAKVADIVLANLKPFSRSRLYVKKDELALQDNVRNKTDTDYYQVLGVEKEASDDEIEKAFEEKKEVIEEEDTPEAKEQLEQISAAYQVLTDEGSKENYDSQGIDTTIKYDLVAPNILHLHLTKFSPTTMEDLARVTEKFKDKEGLDTLIFDLRDNIGGAIDGLPYFLGPFIGNDQYAYQFFHQGEKEDFKTKMGWMPSLIQYKKVVVLINEGAQSSAEVMASVLKKYNVGVLVGTKTKGWGTVEKVFKLDNQIDENEEYSVFLVHRLTLREDGQPIEGVGVEPVIDTSDADWTTQLFEYFNDQSIVEATKKILEN